MRTDIKTLFVYPILKFVVWQLLQYNFWLMVSIFTIITKGDYVYAIHLQVYNMQLIHMHTNICMSVCMALQIKIVRVRLETTINFQIAKYELMRQ